MNRCARFKVARFGLDWPSGFTLIELLGVIAILGKYALAQTASRLLI